MVWGDDKGFGELEGFEQAGGYGLVFVPCDEDIGGGCVEACFCQEFLDGGFVYVGGQGDEGCARVIAGGAEEDGEFFDAGGTP